LGTLAEGGARLLIAMTYPLVILTSEYDEHPRGRIVFDRRADCFLLYADRRIQTKVRLDAIREAFGLSRRQVAVKGDPHYR